MKVHIADHRRIDFSLDFFVCKIKIESRKELDTFYKSRYSNQFLDNFYEFGAEWWKQ